MVNGRVLRPFTQSESSCKVNESGLPGYVKLADFQKIK